MNTIDVGEPDDDCGHHSWVGLMRLLDEHWPADLFPTRPDYPTRDAGARIVSLLRWVSLLNMQGDLLVEQTEAHAERFTKIRTLHRREGFSQQCIECQDEWPCPTYDLADWDQPGP